MLPANSTLTNGAGTFSADVASTAGSQTITATDTVTRTITGTPAIHHGQRGCGNAFRGLGARAATAGTAFNFTVTALDAFNNTATGYAGRVHFTEHGRTAVLPANSPLTNGVGTFTATLKTTGIQTLTATDTSDSAITGTSNNITVSAAAATHFVVSAPGAATAGAAFNFTVTAQDEFNNTATGYAGTAHFTSRTARPCCPPMRRLTNGVGHVQRHAQDAGNQTITATDTVDSSITGASEQHHSSAPRAATHFMVSAPASATAGTAFNFTVTAQDQFNNTATGLRGHRAFHQHGWPAVLPANATLTNGTGTFSATLKTSATRRSPRPIPLRRRSPARAATSPSAPVPPRTSSSLRRPAPRRAPPSTSP